MNGISDFLKDWTDLIKSIFSRFAIGFKNPMFSLYFIFVLIMMGGMGVWFEYFNIELSPSLNQSKGCPSNTTFVNTMATYFMAVFATAASDLILGEKKKGEPDALRKMIPIVMIIVGFVFFIWSHNSKSQPIACLGIFFSLISWWIANSSDRKYKATTYSPQAPLGGDPNKQENDPNKDSLSEIVF